MSDLIINGTTVSDSIPPRRRDLDGQNIESVRFDLAGSIRATVEHLNRQMRDAHTAGLIVGIYSGSPSMADVPQPNHVSVSIYERRRY